MSPSQEPGPGVVRAAGGTSWPGTDVEAAQRAVLETVPPPHLPTLPELPARGPGADPVGRTAALLEELSVDLKPHGWRLAGAPGVDARRAVSWWNSDLQRLADAAGKQGIDLPELVVGVRGPLSLAARLWLPSGERVLSDHGARRDVRDALAAGLAERVRQVRSVTGAGRVTVLLEEPDVGRVLAGTLPTASGYRTVRALPRAEVAQAWSTVAGALAEVGAGVLIAPGRAEGTETMDWAELAALVRQALPSAPTSESEENETADRALRGLVLPLAPLEGPGADPARWDLVAEWTDAAGDLMVDLPAAAVQEQAAALWRDWGRYGLPSGSLGLLAVRPTGLDRLSPQAAVGALSASVRAAEELERIRRDGGLDVR